MVFRRGVPHSIGPIVSIGLGILLLIGCFGPGYVKNPIRDPLVNDPLKGGSIASEAEYGSFSKEGWQPGERGVLMYELPGMPQGLIQFDVTGLSRTQQDTIFVTLYEPNNSKYADPFILKNPFRITLALNNFYTAPDSPFSFVWTAKNFPAGTTEENRYVDGIPESIRGYQENKLSDRLPIYPNATYTIRIEWRSGKAQLFVNDQLLAVHEYAPVLFNPKKLSLVLGHSPGISQFDLENITFSNVVVKFPSNE